MHRADDMLEIGRISEELIAYGYFAYCRRHGTIPLLFALGQEKAHSVDVRHRGERVAVEYWFGYPDDDFIREEPFQSVAETVAPVRGWLAKETAR